MSSFYKAASSVTKVSDSVAPKSPEALTAELEAVRVKAKDSHVIQTESGPYLMWWLDALGKSYISWDAYNKAWSVGARNMPNQVPGSVDDIMFPTAEDAYNFLSGLNKIAFEFRDKLTAFVQSNK